MLRLSNVTVLSVLVLCAHTASPHITLFDIVMEIPLVICVHDTPSEDMRLVKLLPERTMRSQYGTAVPLMSAASAALPPVVVRYCTLPPCDTVGEIIAKIYFEFEFVVSRIITPAFAHASDAVWLMTRAVMAKSPACGWE